MDNPALERKVLKIPAIGLPYTLKGICQYIQGVYEGDIKGLNRAPRSMLQVFRMKLERDFDRQKRM